MPIDEQALAKTIWSSAKAQALELAKLKGPAAGKKKLTTEQEDIMWMTEAKDWTPEKAAELWAKPGATAEAIGLEQYPHRIKIMESDGRALDKLEQARYGMKVAQRIDPSWTPLPPKGALPPPSPFDEQPLAAPEAPPEMAGLPASEGMV